MNCIEMTIIQSTFNKKTRNEFLSGSRTYFGSKDRMKKYGEGTYVLCQDIESREIFGVARLGRFEDGSSCREHHLLDTDTYSGDHAKYNGFDICISKFIEWNRSFDDVSFLFNLQSRPWNNITVAKPYNFTKLTYKADDEKQVLLRIEMVIEDLFAIA